MKLQLTYRELSAVFHCELPESDVRIDRVAFDTRKFSSGTGVLFVALTGDFRDGHAFIREAYSKGVRLFLVREIPLEDLPGASFIQHQNTLAALQELASYHRNKFNIPVIGITGSAGKTIVKEWLSVLLSTKYRVVRSPKSYNSQLGVALSLLEITSDAEIAVIEAGISHRGEMRTLADMIRPTVGILTSIGSAHRENFDDEASLLTEKLILFDSASDVFYHEKITLDPAAGFHPIKVNDFAELTSFALKDNISSENAALAIAVANFFGIASDAIRNELAKIDHVTMRMETFEGINNSIIINDAYNLDLDAFRSSLEYQLSIAGSRKRIVVVGMADPLKEKEIKDVIKAFEPIESHFITKKDIHLPEFENAVILFKGNRSLGIEALASRFRLKKHKTYVTIDLDAIRENLAFYRSRLPAATKLLVMVKASSYGSGGDKLAQFLERAGIAYLGVAYIDEGVELRRNGVQTPILVMNPEESSFDDCIKFNLEPAIYTITQLDAFIKQLIYAGISNYPIHLKLETGMNRLGFNEQDLENVLQLLQGQPEVFIRSVYSHLSDSDNPNSTFVASQAKRFDAMISRIREVISYHFDRHLLNSEGVVHFPELHYEMVRIGIGMFGFSTNKAIKTFLKPVIQWHSTVSQVKRVHAGESIGYGQESKADKNLEIAVIPVGYADGFRRSLSRGKGGVMIAGGFCPVVGNVCMDMIMVDVTGKQVEIGTEVEIIGPHQDLIQFAQQCDTIPYEVLTGISRRVHRIYLES